MNPRCLTRVARILPVDVPSRFQLEVEPQFQRTRASRAVIFAQQFDAAVRKIRCMKRGGRQKKQCEFRSHVQGRQSLCAVTASTRPVLAS